TWTTRPSRSSASISTWRYPRPGTPSVRSAALKPIAEPNAAAFEHLAAFQCHSADGGRHTGLFIAGIEDAWRAFRAIHSRGIPDRSHHRSRIGAAAIPCRQAVSRVRVAESGSHARIFQLKS